MSTTPNTSSTTAWNSMPIVGLQSISLTFNLTFITFIWRVGAQACGERTRSPQGRVVLGKQPRHLRLVIFSLSGLHSPVSAHLPQQGTAPFYVVLVGDLTSNVLTPAWCGTISLGQSFTWHSCRGEAHRSHLRLLVLFCERPVFVVIAVLKHYVN